jgi:hypothetical protein
MFTVLLKCTNSVTLFLYFQVVYEDDDKLLTPKGCTICGNPKCQRHRYKEVEQAIRVARGRVPDTSFSEGGRCSCRSRIMTACV